MGASFQQIQIIGNTGSDPEVVYLNSGSCVAKFSIAVTESYNNKNGERIDTTEWFRIEMWESLAKVAEKYLKKGNQVFIQGKIRTDNWTDKEGNQRSGITIRANQMSLLGGNPQTPANGITSGPAANQPQQQRPTSPVPPSMASNGDESNDLPF